MDRMNPASLQEEEHPEGHNGTGESVVFSRYFSVSLNEEFDLNSSSEHHYQLSSQSFHQESDTNNTEMNAELAEEGVDNDEPRPERKGSWRAGPRRSDSGGAAAATAAGPAVDGPSSLALPVEAPAAAEPPRPSTSPEKNASPPMDRPPSPPGSPRQGRARTGSLGGAMVSPHPGARGSARLTSPRDPPPRGGGGGGGGDRFAPAAPPRPVSPGPRPGHRVLEAADINEYSI